MDWHASLIRIGIAPLWARWEGSLYLRHYRTLLTTQYDEPPIIQARQFSAVRAMVDHAWRTVPYYRSRLESAGIYPRDIKGLEDFRRVPMLHKSDIRRHGRQMISTVYQNAVLQRKTTSGSTGVSLQVWMDEESSQWKRACTLRSDEWSGWRFGEAVARIWGNPDYLQRGWRGWLRNRLLDRATYLDTLHVSEESLERFARHLLRHQPPLIFGHAHSVYLLADCVRALSLGAIRPRGIITTAMVLHNWQRKVIEEVFQCRVTNRYGCEEVSLIACECERHQGLHINADGVYVEVLRDDGPARPGEHGVVVVTDLTNRAMPIIRYQVGDVAVPADRRCPCGRGFPLLERIEGRDADYVVTPGRQAISGISLTENFALVVPGIAQLQIVQESLHRFVFRIVRSPDFGSESLRQIELLVARRFGPDVVHECEFVDRIPQEPSGKYRFCISKVPNPFTRPMEAVAG